MRIILLKCPAENAGNGISEILNSRIFWGEFPHPDPPRLSRLRRYNFSSPCVYTFQISCNAFGTTHCLAALPATRPAPLCLHALCNFFLFQNVVHRAHAYLITQLFLCCVCDCYLLTCVSS